MPRKGEGSRLTDRERVQHMRQAAADGVSFVQGRTRGDLDNDAMLRRALVHSVQEIGEAAARVSQPGRDRVPGVPWAKVVGMRHILVHVYHDLDLDAVWRVATVELAPLVHAIDAALASWPPD